MLVQLYIKSSKNCSNFIKKVIEYKSVFEKIKEVKSIETENI